jgi:hypothetical protein
MVTVAVGAKATLIVYLIELAPLAVRLPTPVAVIVDRFVQLVLLMPDVLVAPIVGAVPAAPSANQAPKTIPNDLMYLRMIASPAARKPAGWLRPIGR